MEDIKHPIPTDIGSLNTGNDEISSVTTGVNVKRVQLLEDEKLDRVQFLEQWQEQNRYIDQLEAKLKVFLLYT